MLRRRGRGAEQQRMPNIGPMELVIVLALALLVLGPARLPSAGRAMGAGIRNFKTSITGAGEETPEQLETT